MNKTYSHTYRHVDEAADLRHADLARFEQHMCAEHIGLRECERVAEAVCM
jgi:hypothetical protein